MEELKRLIGHDEKIFYSGKPNKSCYIFESIFNPLLPFALIWAFADFSFIVTSIFLSQETEGFFFFFSFFAIHLMPVWMYLGGVIFTIKRYNNTAYIVTDKAIYVSGGTFAQNINTKPFAELSHIDLHRGMFDQKFGVGDIIATSSQLNQNGKNTTISIDSIENYIEVYNLVKKLQTDIYTDVMYPNDKRPKYNHGYNTEYKNKTDYLK